MSDRTFTIHTPLLPWTRRLARSMSGVAGSTAVEPRRAQFGLPDAGFPASTGGPRRPGFLALLRAAWRRHQTRRCLAELDAATLKDIGISYAEAEAEANKPFWIA